MRPQVWEWGVGERRRGGGEEEMEYQSVIQKLPRRFDCYQSSPLSKDPAHHARFKRNGNWAPGRAYGTRRARGCGGRRAFSVKSLWLIFLPAPLPTPAADARTLRPRRRADAARDGTPRDANAWSGPEALGEVRPCRTPAREPHAAGMRGRADAEVAR